MKRTKHYVDYIYMTLLTILPIVAIILSTYITIDGIKIFKESLTSQLEIDLQSKKEESIEPIFGDGFEIQNTVLLIEEEEEIDPYELSFAERNDIISVNSHTNLGYDNILITAEEMNDIIDYWDSQSGGTAFTGYGSAFISIAEDTGLNPIYIFAHAAVESAWGKSSMAVNKNNYFGIHAYDSNPDLALTMGNSIFEGIYNGAAWIARNYYNEGQDTLHLMIYGPKQYASAADAWINQIVSIMNTSYGVLYNNKI